MVKRIKFTSPKGTFGYPCAIKEPDTKFSDDTDPNDKGAYKGRLILPSDSPEAQAFQRKLEMFFAEHIKDTCGKEGKKICKTDLEFIENEDFHMAVADHVEDFSKKKGKNPRRIVLEEDNIPWFPETDKDGELTGNTGFRLKLNACVAPKGKEPWEQRPKVFNANRQLLTDVPNIGPGTTGIFAGQINPWCTSKIGMTLWLEAVQVIDLVEGQGGGNAEDFGFGEEEGSYTDAGEYEEAMGGGDAGSTDF